jgi:hypothetical protein
MGLNCIGVPVVLIVFFYLVFDNTALETMSKDCVRSVIPLVVHVHTVPVLIPMHRDLRPIGPAHPRHIDDIRHLGHEI